MYNFVMFSMVRLYSLSLPIVGHMASGIKKGVKKTLSHVDKVVYYIGIFFIVLSVIFSILLLIWGYKLYKNNKNRKKLYKIITLLHRIQSDLVLLQESGNLSENQLLEMELSKKDAIGEVRGKISDKFFRDRLGEHAYSRIVDALEFIENDKISLPNQAIVVAQWLKTLDLLCR
jgi:cell division protein FtsL